jgi:uncharacterized RDD family membrane protein YckC
VFLFAPNKGKRAGVGRRFLAAALDPIVFLAAWLVPSAFIGAVLGGSAAMFTAVGLLCALVVFQLRLIIAGQTLGKAVLSERVVRRQDGGTPGFGRMLLRETFGKCVSGVFLGIGFFWAIFDRDGQTWHDKISGTVVLTAERSAGGSIDGVAPARESADVSPPDPVNEFINPRCEATRTAGQPRDVPATYRLDTARWAPALQARPPAPQPQPDAPKVGGLACVEQGDAVGAGEEVPAGERPPARASVGMLLGATALGLAGTVLVAALIWPPIRLNNRLPLYMSVVISGDRSLTLAPFGHQTVLVLRRARLDIRWEARANSVGVFDRAAPAHGVLAESFRGSPLSLKQVTFGATIGDERFFAPLITNERGQELRLYVNEGPNDPLGVLCCIVRPGVVRQPVGVFPLFAQSTVRGIYANGETVIFDGIAPAVDSVSGQVSLRFVKESRPSASMAPDSMHSTSARATAWRGQPALSRSRVVRARVGSSR